MNLKLYYFPACPFCQRVLQTIAKLNISDKVTLKNTHDSDEVLNERMALNISGKQVPCLVVDGKPMMESGDIIEFLEQKFS